MLDSSEPDTAVLDADLGAMLSDIPTELIGTVLGHFADTASLAEADVLAPAVTAASPIPFEAEIDGVGSSFEPTVPAPDSELDDAHPDDADPDGFDRSAEPPEPGSDPDAADTTDQNTTDQNTTDQNTTDQADTDHDPGDFDGTQQTANFSGSTEPAQADPESDGVTAEGFGSGDASNAVLADVVGADSGMVDDLGVSWDADPFALDHVGHDAVGDVVVDEPMSEFESVDIDDGTGAEVIDAADDDIDGIA